MRQRKELTLGSKMAHPHNSECTLSIAFELCTMKEAKSYMKIILMFFPKKNLVWGKWAILSRANGPFGPKNDACLYVWICWNLILILQRESG